MKKFKKLTIAVASTLLLGLLVGCGEAGPQGEQGPQGNPGQDGVSIVKIIKTDSDELIDTYTIYYSNNTTSSFVVRNGEDGHDGKDGSTPYIGPNGTWWIDGEDTGVIAGEDATEKEYVISEFQSAVDTTTPGRIITNQTFELPTSDIILHYNSNLTIEYGDEIKSRYEYSYERLNEIVTGEEEMISLISGVTYSNGSVIYDGVDWINKADKTVTMNGVNLIYTEKNEDGSYPISHNVLNGHVKDSKIKSFFGINYDISNLNYAIVLNGTKLKSVRLTFECNIDGIEERANVVSYTTFSLDSYTVNIPE